MLSDLPDSIELAVSGVDLVMTGVLSVLDSDNFRLGVSPKLKDRINADNVFILSPQIIIMAIFL